MKPETQTYSIDSTLAGEDVAMSLDPGAAAHLMGVMTELYSDRETAVLREYATNALDAHVEAGVSGPIQVRLPNQLSPTLTIQDYGRGLSADDIRSIYSQYGASTKRDSNDAVGMLGLGCKSGLAYADTFTLTSVCSGERIAVAVSRDEEGGGTMTILERTEVDEPTGVRVDIPVAADNGFERKAAEFFRFWRKGTVEVNGEEPAGLSDELSLGDGLTLTRELHESVVVMGNVPYPAPELDELVNLPYGVSIVARVDIGAVQFTPAREALMDTKRTRDTLRRIADDYATATERTATEAVAAAETPGAAVTALLAIQDKVGDVPGIEWRGRELPAELRAWSGMERFRHIPRRSYNYGMTGDNRNSEHATLPFSTAVNAIWVTDFTNQNWTTPMRRKLDAYVDAHELSDLHTTAQEYVLVPTGRLKSEWLSEVVTLSWSDVRSWRDPNRPGGYGGGGTGETYAGTYPAYTQGSYCSKTELAAIAETELEVFYVEGGGKCEHGHEAAKLDDAILVELSTARAAKFKRLVPDAAPAQPELRSRAASWLKGLTDDQLTGLCYGHFYAGYGMRAWSMDDLRKLDPNRLADDEVAEFVRNAKLYDEELAAELDTWRTWLPADKLPEQRRPKAEWARRYPLFDPDEPEDSYLYMAAKVASTQKGA